MNVFGTENYLQFRLKPPLFKYEIAFTASHNLLSQCIHQVHEIIISKKREYLWQ